MHHSMKRWSQLIVTTVAVCVFSNATWAEPAAAYDIAPVPEWVEVIKAAEARSDMDTVGGERHLLFDRQYYDDGDTIARHYHYVTEVAGQAGLSDNSKLSITFDPSYERLELHVAQITRDGRFSDRLQRARIDVARTEEESDSDLLNGNVTALVVLPDVRVGDIVKVRYTLFGRNPVFGRQHHSRWRMTWSVPVERASVRITVPQSMKLRHGPEPEKTRFTERVNAGLRTLHWMRDGIEPIEIEEKTPGWVPRSYRLDVTAYSSWQEVARWGTSLFRGHASSGVEYQQLSRSIQRVKDAQGIDAAISMAIDHVQKNIRYYGLELGENSHRPHSPDEVLANGYGDCKDKALLLIALLGDLDIDAWPLLVSTRLKQGIANRLPSPGLFNHVVVLVEHNGQQHWVDATDSRQEGLLGTRGQPEYGAGLVLGKPGDAIVTRQEVLPEKPDSSSHDQFYFSSMGGPVDMTNTRVLRGQYANWFRSSLDRSSKRRMQEWSDKRVEKIYGAYQRLDDMTVVEDKLHNEFTISTSYRLKKFWDINKRRNTAEFDAYATSIYNELDEFEFAGKDRRAPVSTSGPLWIQHRVQFYPNMASPERQLEESSFDAAGYSYQDSEYVLGNSLVFDTDLKIDRGSLLAQELPAYRKFRERVQRNASIGRYMTSIRKTQLAIGIETATLLDELGAIQP